VQNLVPVFDPLFPFCKKTDLALLAKIGLPS